MFKSTNPITMIGLAMAGALAFASPDTKFSVSSPVPGAVFAHTGLETAVGKVTKSHLRRRGFRSRRFRNRRFGFRRGIRSRGFGFGRHGYYASPYYYSGHGFRRDFGVIPKEVIIDSFDRFFASVD